MPAGPSLTVIILNWNGWQDTVACLERLARLARGDFRVVLLDNGSADDSVDQIVHWGRQVLGAERPLSVQDDFRDALHGVRTYGDSAWLTVLAGVHNLGFCGGCNLAVRFALRDKRLRFVFLLNNDAIPEPDALHEILHVARASGGAIVGSVITGEDGKGVEFAGSSLLGELFYGAWPRRRYIREYLTSPDRASTPVGMVPGSAMLIRRDLLDARFAESGYLFLPDLFMYGDELELCAWAKERGYGILVANRSLVRHRGSPPPGDRSRSELLRRYYTSRNIRWVARLHLASLTSVAFQVYYPCLRTVQAAWKLIAGEPRVAWAILEGLIDSYRGRTGQWRAHLRSVDEEGG